jgi:choline dehydrogenase-like flavoprotein
MRRTTLESDPEALSSSSSMFDSIVVGAGSSGLTVARTLFERGLSVLIIEAGPAPFLTHILNTDLRLARDLLRDLRDSVQYSPSLASGGQFGNNFSCFGGRGLFWNGAAPRYAPDDFSGWPLSSLPDDEDYRWAETEFRVSTSVGETPMARRMLKILTTAGIPAEPGPFAVDVENLSVSRLSAGIASGLGLFFRRCGNATAKGDIKVATSTLVQSLIVEDKRVAGVVVSGRDISRPVEILSRSVVLCGGGIESVRLAAVSEVPDPADRIG